MNERQRKWWRWRVQVDVRRFALPPKAREIASAAHRITLADYRNHLFDRACALGEPKNRAFGLSSPIKTAHLRKLLVHRERQGHVALARLLLPGRLLPEHRDKCGLQLNRDPSSGQPGDLACSTPILQVDSQRVHPNFVLALTDWPQGRLPAATLAAER